MIFPGSSGIWLSRWESVINSTDSTNESHPVRVIGAGPQVLQGRLGGLRSCRPEIRDGTGHEWGRTTRPTVDRWLVNCRLWCFTESGGANGRQHRSRSTFVFSTRCQVSSFERKRWTFCDKNKYQTVHSTSPFVSVTYGGDWGWPCWVVCDFDQVVSPLHKFCNLQSGIDGYTGWLSRRMVVFGARVLASGWPAHISVLSSQW